jgi:hypothetical protein
LVKLALSILTRLLTAKALPVSIVPLPFTVFAPELALVDKSFESVLELLFRTDKLPVWHPTHPVVIPEKLMVPT